jgi:hypothetical protein
MIKIAKLLLISQPHYRPSDIYYTFWSTAICVPFKIIVAVVITVHSLRLLEDMWDHKVKTDWKPVVHTRIQTVPSCILYTFALWMCLVVTNKSHEHVNKVTWAYSSKICLCCTLTHFSHITTKIYTITMILTVELETVFNTEFAGKHVWFIYILDFTCPTPMVHWLLQSYQKLNIDFMQPLFSCRTF